MCMTEEISASKKTIVRKFSALQKNKIKQKSIVCMIKNFIFIYQTYVGVFTLAPWQILEN